MVLVHHLENSRSQRILWMLEELGLPYEVRRYRRKWTMGAPAELKRIHPLGKSPIIEHDGAVLAETGAIMTHLVETSGCLGPGTDPEEKRRWRYFMHYAEGSVMASLIVWMVIGAVPLLGRIPRFFFQKVVDNHLDFIESELASRAWFAGSDFSSADIIMEFPVAFAAARIHGLRNRPRTAEWLATVQARSAYRAALDSGGPYSLA